MKKIMLLLTMLLIVVSLSACHEHTWVDATCTEAKTCSSCDAVLGVALGHTWKDATCTEARTCTVCGMTAGDATGHNWSDANCTTPKTCATCGITEGDATGHRWNEATCTTPKACYICNITEGSEKGHDWETINAYTQACKTCGITEIDQSKYPVKLGTLRPSGGNNHNIIYDQVDVYGNEFYEGLSFNLEYSYYRVNKEETEYVVNKRYKKFTTTAMVEAGSKDKFEGRLKIYLDDVLVYDSKAINKKTRPIDIEIDISNATFIKIETSVTASKGEIMLANPMLHY